MKWSSCLLILISLNLSAVKNIAGDDCEDCNGNLILKHDSALNETAKLADDLKDSVTVDEIEFAPMSEDDILNFCQTAFDDQALATSNPEVKISSFQKLLITQSKSFQNLKKHTDSFDAHMETSEYIEKMTQRNFILDEDDKIRIAFFWNKIVSNFNCKKIMGKSILDIDQEGSITFQLWSKGQGRNALLFLSKLPNVNINKEQLYPEIDSGIFKEMTFIQFIKKIELKHKCAQNAEAEICKRAKWYKAII